LTTLGETIRNAKRTQREYWEGDGIAAILGGVFSLLIGVVVYAGAHGYRIAEEVSHNWLLGTCLVVAVLGSKVVALAKGRVTDRRTGYTSRPNYAELAEEHKNLVVPSLLDPSTQTLQEPVGTRGSHGVPLLVHAIAAAAGYGVLLLDDPSPCLLAALMAGLYSYYIDRQRWFRHFGIASVFLMMFVSHVNRRDRLWYFLTGFGVVLLIDGIARLIRFLRANPAAHEPLGILLTPTDAATLQDDEDIARDEESLIAQRRGYISWTKDGIPRLVSGAFCGMAGVFFGTFVFGKSQLFGWIAIVDMFVLFRVWMLNPNAPRESIDWLKERFTSPQMEVIYSREAVSSNAVSRVFRLPTPVSLALPALLFIQLPWLFPVLVLLAAVVQGNEVRKGEPYSCTELPGVPLLLLGLYFFKLNTGQAMTIYLIAWSAMSILEGGARFLFCLWRPPAMASPEA